MKKILIIDNDQKFIGEMQIKLAGVYDVLATEDIELVDKLIKTVMINTLLARLPIESDLEKSSAFNKMLKKLNRKKYRRISKIVIAPDGCKRQINEYTKLGVSAVLMDVSEIERWVK